MAAKERFFRPGQALFNEGDHSDCMYLIKKGSVAVRKRKGSAWVELARVYANEVIGELAFFDRAPRSASAVALTEVEVLEISFDQLDDIWKKVPDYLKTIMKAVAERLRKANDQIRRLQKHLVTDEDEESSEVQETASETAEILRETMDIDDIAGRDIEGLVPEGSDSAEETNETDESES